MKTIKNSTICIIVLICLFTGCNKNTDTSNQNTKDESTTVSKATVTETVKESSIVTTTTTDVFIPDCIPEQENYYGNSASNLANDGLVANQGDWIYYQNQADGRKLYKMRTDTTKKTKLNNDGSYNINVVGDWVYYLDNYSGNIFKIRVDGAQKIKLSDDKCENITVVNGFIYYVGTSDDSIYRMKIDGTEKIKLSGDSSIYRISVLDDWIYYIDGNGASVNKMKTDGTEKAQIPNIFGRDFYVADNSIYYLNLYDNDKLYRSCLDGTDIVKLSDDYCGNFYAVGDWIYYTNSSNEICKVKTDLTGYTKLADNSFDFNMVGDWIYYLDRGKIVAGKYENIKLRRIKTDGTENRLVD